MKKCKKHGNNISGPTVMDPTKCPKLKLSAGPARSAWKGLDMSEEKGKVKAGCTISSLTFDPTAKTVTWESILKSSLKCDAWDIGEYSTRVDGTRIPLETLMRALITQYIGVRKINAPLKKLSRSAARAALDEGFDWNTMFTRSATKLTPAEQARSSASKITDLGELNELIEEMKKQALLLSASNEKEAETQI